MSPSVMGRLSEPFPEILNRCASLSLVFACRPLRPCSLPAAAHAQGADPAGSGPIVAALGWLQGTLLGNVATAVAVMAVAAVGFMMLTGRMNWRFGATVIIGLLHPVRRGLDRRRHPVRRGGGLRPMELVRHPVHRALTRPQMFAGVTYNFFIINAAVTTELFLITGSFLALPAAVVIHGDRLFRLPARAAGVRLVDHQGQPLPAGAQLEALGLQQLRRLRLAAARSDAMKHAKWRLGAAAWSAKEAHAGDRLPYRAAGRRAHACCCATAR